MIKTIGLFLAGALSIHFTTPTPYAVQESYNFTDSADFTITSYDKKGKAGDPVSGVMYTHREKAYVGMEIEMEGSQGFNIFDLEAKKMYVLIEMNGMKTGIKKNIKEDSKQEEDEAQMEFTKTGKTKEIAGYTCYEYTSEDDEYQYQFWVADNENMPFDNAFMSFQKANKSKDFSNSTMPKGLTMEMTSTGKKKGERTHYIINKINENISKNVDLSGYKLMGF